jgi:hypothetical protein
MLMLTWCQPSMASDDCGVHLECGMSDYDRAVRRNQREAKAEAARRCEADPICRAQWRNSHVPAAMSPLQMKLDELTRRVDALEE